MNYDEMYPKVADQEIQKRESLAQRGLAFEAFSIPIPRESYTLDGFLCRRSKDEENTYFVDERVDKDMVVMHFTVGYLHGDLPTLVHPKPNYRVSTNFLIGRDGTIYQLFSSAQWAYHLGKSAVGGNSHNSRRSVSIELSNLGPLQLNGSRLQNVYKGDYCSLSDQDAYIKLDQPYRGFQYYMTHTEEQYESLIILLRYLTSVYDIPRSFLPEAKRMVPFGSSSEARAFKGISTHVNFRKSGKYDIGPAFEWQKVIAGVMADTFQPKPKLRGRSAFAPQPEVNSVEELETTIEKHMSPPPFDASLYGEEGQEPFDPMTDPPMATIE
jgi:N-acetylmuramoyl-L-alanine amidase